jgi:hypothetical protein
MNRLVGDYFRRKWWIMLLGGAVELVVGWFAAPGSDGALGGSTFLGFQVALFMGAVLLSFDLQFGLARLALTLPLTPKQIGRGWWLATVGLPGLMISGLLFAGALGAHWFHPQTVLPAAALLEICAVIFLWLGTCFVAVFNIAPGLGGSWWHRIRNVVVGGAWGGLLGGGFMIFQNMQLHPSEMIGFAVVGGGATLYGWLRADNLLLFRACHRPGAGPASLRGGRRHAPTGLGGIPLLVGTVFTRSLLMGLGMVAIFLVMMLVQGQTLAGREVAQRLVDMSNAFPIWVIVLVQLVPVMLQLRFLRTLPLSANGLALLILGLTLAPLLALGLVLAGGAGLVLGLAKGLVVLKAFSFALLPAALCICFGVWFGAGRSSYALAIMVMSGAQALPLILHLDQAPLLYIVPGVTGCMVLAFGLVRHGLLHRSKAYRVPANLTAMGSGWGWSGHR